MTPQQLKALGIDDPSQPITRGELVAYMATVLDRERERLRRIFIEYMEYPPTELAEMIAAGDDDVLRWR